MTYLLLFYNGDTIAILLMLIGNGLFTILVLMSKITMFVYEFIIQHISFGIFFILIMKVVFYILFIVPLYISELVVAVNSRGNEYRADEFAFKIGYGTELVSALYLLQDIIIPSKISIRERLRQSHPHLASRIRRLEEMNNI